MDRVVDPLINGRLYITVGFADPDDLSHFPPVMVKKTLVLFDGFDGQ